MFHAINITYAFALPLRIARLEQLSQLNELLTLKTIKQSPSQRLIKILLDPSNDFFQEIHLCGSSGPPSSLLLKVFIHNEVDGELGWQGN